MMFVRACIFTFCELYSVYCCGADKRVDSVNNSRVLMCASVWQPETMKGDRRRDDRYNKSEDFICRNYKRVCKCPWRL